MEKAIVSFLDPETQKEVKITMSYDKENSLIDYNVKLSDNYSASENLGFSSFLAKMFLDSLQTENKEENKIDE